MPGGGTLPPEQTREPHTTATVAPHHSHGGQTGGPARSLGGCRHHLLAENVKRGSAQRIHGRGTDPRHTQETLDNQQVPCPHGSMEYGALLIIHGIHIRPRFDEGIENPQKAERSGHVR